MLWRLRQDPSLADAYGDMLARLVDSPAAASSCSRPPGPQPPPAPIPLPSLTCARRRGRGALPRPGRASPRSPRARAPGSRRAARPGSALTPSRAERNLARRSASTDARGSALSSAIVASSAMLSCRAASDRRPWSRSSRARSVSFLADQLAVGRPQHGRQPRAAPALVGGAHVRSAPAAHRIAPASVRDLLAGAVADARDQCLPAIHRVDVGVRGHQTERVQRPVEDRDGRLQLNLADSPEPAHGLGLALEPFLDLDHCRARRADRLAPALARPGCDGAHRAGGVPARRALRARARASGPRRERREAGASGSGRRVARHPRKLELREAKQLRPRTVTWTPRCSTQEAGVAMGEDKGLKQRVGR